MSDPPDIMLRLTGDAEEVLYDVHCPLAHGRNAARVGVGEIGNRSSVWRFWGNPKGDFYIAARTIADVVKFSLHASGNWRYGLTSAAAPNYVSVEADRAIDKWQRPAEVVEGWTRGVTIWMRAKDLAPVPNDTGNDNVTWFPPPPPGRIAGLQLVVGRADVAAIPVGSGLPRFAWTLNAREAAVLFVIEVDLEPEFDNWLDERREDALQSAIGKQMPMDLPAPRIGIFSTDAEGSRHVYDLDGRVR